MIILIYNSVSNNNDYNHNNRLGAWRRSAKTGFGLLVMNLCVSDFLMGVYLAIIGITDQVYQGNYLHSEETWKSSIGCKVNDTCILIFLPFMYLS